MKWIVVWIVVNSWIIPCDHGPTEWVNEYGQKYYSNTYTLETCWDSEGKSMEKEFDSYAEAYSFMVQVNTECSDCSDIKIIKKAPSREVTAMKRNYLEIYFWKEPEEYGGEWGASTAEEPFNNISGLAGTKLEALKEFCVALIAAIEIEIEDSN